MRFDPRRVMDDVAACSAAYLVNLLPELATAPMPEAFGRLHRHFLAALKAYRYNARRVRRAARPGDDRCA